MSQSRTHSALESLLNVALGFGVAIAAQLTIFPLFNLHPSLADNVAISLIFTVISLLRGYFVRRVFNKWHQRGT